MLTIDELTSIFPRAGRVTWIGVRPNRRAPIVTRERARIGLDGLEGDHRNKAGPRALTLIQAEHLPVIAALAGHADVDPALLRRNMAVAGINNLALKDRVFRLGTSVLRGTGVCAPCSRMEEALGAGGYNAMRGHGGITAEVVEAGETWLGAEIIAAREEAVQRGN